MYWEGPPAKQANLAIIQNRELSPTRIVGAHISDTYAQRIASHKRHLMDLEEKAVGLGNGRIIVSALLLFLFKLGSICNVVRESC